jgi:hypothetical protein
MILPWHSASDALIIAKTYLMCPDATQGEALVQCCLLLLIVVNPKLIVMSRSI